MKIVYLNTTGRLEILDYNEREDIYLVDSTQPVFPEAHNIVAFLNNRGGVIDPKYFGLSPIEQYAYGKDSQLDILRDAQMWCSPVRDSLIPRNTYIDLPFGSMTTNEIVSKIYQDVSFRGFSFITSKSKQLQKFYIHIPSNLIPKAFNVSFTFERNLSCSLGFYLNDGDEYGASAGVVSLETNELTGKMVGALPYSIFSSRGGFAPVGMRKLEIICFNEDLLEFEVKIKNFAVWV